MVRLNSTLSILRVERAQRGQEFLAAWLLQPSTATLSPALPNELKRALRPVLGVRLVLVH